MTRSWALSRESFERLLQHLAPDREQAAAAYETLRVKLIRFFEWRGAAQPEELADRTLDRLARRLESGERVEQVFSYCCGIARMVILEQRRTREQEEAVAYEMLREAPAPVQNEGMLAPLQNCLERLPSRSRQLVLGYYHEEKRAKVDHRKNLAQRLGIPINALRLRAFRVRSWLERCVEESLRQEGHR